MHNAPNTGGCTWLTCDECFSDYLVPDAWIAEKPTTRDKNGYRVERNNQTYITTKCPRCEDLGYTATDKENEHHANPQ